MNGQSRLFTDLGAVCIQLEHVSVVETVDIIAWVP
jgi:hypothetical protein